MSIVPPPSQQNKGSLSQQNAPRQTRDPWSLHLATVAGIPIRVHFTFLLFLIWIALSGRHGASGITVVFVVAIFACVVLHELGHSLVALRDGIPVSSITLYPIGGVAMIEKQPRPKQEFWIALAGPAVNVVIALILWLSLGLPAWHSVLTVLTQPGLSWHGFAERIMLVNVLLVVFNLIPAFPMDGGRVLRAVLAMSLPAVRATQIAAWIGQFIAVAAGVFALETGRYWYLLIAFFVYIGAGQEAGSYRQAALIEGIPLQEAMIKDVRTLNVGNTLREAADILLNTSQHDFPVLHGDSVQGLLTRNDLLRGLSQQGPESYVAGVMSREFAVAGPADDLAESLPRLQGASGPLLVVDGDHLLGMVTTDNIQEFLAIRQISAARLRQNPPRMV
jgi:Zn-dependent protease/CBS domain-containing protein